MHLQARTILLCRALKIGFQGMLSISAYLFSFLLSLHLLIHVDFLGKLSSSDDVSSFEFRTPFIIQSVSEESLNKDYDLRQGDIVVSLNGQEIKYADQITKLLKENSNRTIEVELLRDSFRLKKTLNVDENGNLGIFHGATVKDMVDLGYMEVVQNSYSLIESISVGTNNFVSFMGFYFDQLAGQNKNP